VSALWHSSDAVAATGGRTTATWQAGGVSIDTRTLQPGDLFVAIKGDARDGHEFVAQALNGGAAAALVSQVSKDWPAAGPLLVVKDTLEALRRLGTASRARSKARVAAVTGSVGKTSTKEALRQALSAQGQTHASEASYNNHWGVPLSLARMPESAAYAIFEIGMNHAGEITPLTMFARPHAAIVTTVEAVHLEHFKSIDAIADAKGEIFAGLEPGGVAVVNRDNPLYNRVRGHAERSRAGQVWSFGADAGSEARLTGLKLLPTQSQVSAEIFGERIDYIYGAPGRHLVMNSLGVLLIIKALGADVRKAADSFGKFTAIKGRGERTRLSVEGGAFDLIDESYNANPASMAAAIALLSHAQSSGRKIAVLGDMLELGGTAEELHASLVNPLKAAEVDLVFVSGPLMSRLWSVLPDKMRGAYGQSSADIAPLVAAEARPGDTVMVKGSFGSRMGLVVEALKARGQA
jgi:UDP-N-acetylmuramoyl-tripeptide--D-alanyl-D-alanine ligase